MFFDVKNYISEKGLRKQYKIIVHSIIDKNICHCYQKFCMIKN